MPASEPSTKPTSVAPTTATANHGNAPGSGPRAARRRGAASSPWNAPLRTLHSTASAASHGSVMSPAKRRNDRSLACSASRFVRFDTGSSSDALLARCEHA
jgi:hypothetical protein